MAHSLQQRRPVRSARKVVEQYKSGVAARPRPPRRAGSPIDRRRRGFSPRPPPLLALLAVAALRMAIKPRGRRHQLEVRLHLLLLLLCPRSCRATRPSPPSRIRTRRAGRAVAELDDAQIARRKQQRRFKARRILREAIRLSTEEASVAGIDLQGGDFQRLVKIAVEIKKAAAALATSDLLCELGDIQLAMMAAAGKPPQHQA